jgi:hypothetical protein
VRTVLRSLMSFAFLVACVSLGPSRLQAIAMDDQHCSDSACTTSGNCYAYCKFCTDGDNDSLDPSLCEENICDGSMPGRALYQDSCGSDWCLFCQCGELELSPSQIPPV